MSYAMAGSDRRSKAYAAILVALLLLQESRAESALEFDGTNDRVLVPYSDSFPTEAFTLAAWIKMNPPGHRSAIIARGEDDNSFNLSWQLYVNPDGTLQIMLENQNEQNFTYPLTFFSGEPQASCGNAQGLFVADDQWHHVAATRDLSGQLGLYIDGQSRAQCSQTGVPSSNNFQVLSIGCTHGTIGPPPGGVEPPIWFFPGAIDDPAVWNVALSQTEIEQVYDQCVDPADKHLIGFWPFDEGAGQSVADLSGTGNHGFLGAELSSDAADPQWTSIAKQECAPTEANAPKIYWTNQTADKIQRADLDGFNLEDLLTNVVEEPFGIVFDHAAGKMYWTDRGTGKIQRANLDGAAVEDLVLAGINAEVRLALDEIAGKIYWTVAGNIRRANLDGADVEELVSGLNRPTGVTLDLTGGKMYWHDLPNILRANLDGSGFEVLVTTSAFTQAPVSLDLAAGKMYWAVGFLGGVPNKIQRANLDGTNVEDLVIRAEIT